MKVLLHSAYIVKLIVAVKVKKEAALGAASALRYVARIQRVPPLLITLRRYVSSKFITFTRALFFYLNFVSCELF